MPITPVPVGAEIGLRLTKNTAKSFILTFPNTDLTGAVVTLTVKRNPTALDTLLVKTAIVLPPPTAGSIELDFIGSDTAAIPAGFYTYTITSTVGSTVTVLQDGPFTLEPIDDLFTQTVEPILNLSLTSILEQVSISIRDESGVLANPNTLTVSMFDFADNLVVTYNLGDIGLSNPEGGIFSFEFQSNRAGDFLVVWTYRYLGEAPNTIIQNLRFVTGAMFRMIPEIRLYIDKSRKPSEKTIAFNPADVAVYIANALRDFNVTPPTTGLMLENINDVYKEILVQGSIIQSLIAQGLLSVDQDFNYSDNGISLAIDHSTKLQGWYTQLLQSYTTKKKLVKLNFFTPTVLARTIVGQAFALGLSKVPASTLSRFRGWI